ncbi:hypothetical protein PoB_001317700 [Plakobranchus ocellatus]|uniref:Uncharacterized protein n=1 Tax=Plakobranchus ocellatus TaxID=259542 RepID=A0AAV3YUQ6_9GAST|nr:hypothetical protein PoB_001317700 [Plakobranchus ocellatus]
MQEALISDIGEEETEDRQEALIRDRREETGDREGQSDTDRTELEEPPQEEALVPDCRDQTEGRLERSDNGRTEENNRRESLATDRDGTEMRQKQSKPNKNVVQKERRMHGKAYIGRKFDKDNKKYTEVEKDEKSLGQRCSCKASYYKCKEVSERDRQKIHNEIWRMTWYEKKVFVRLSVDVRDVKE